MTNLEMIEFIDEFLSQEEDVLHGIEGENCTKSRKYLETIKKQLALCNVVGQSEQLVCCENCTHFDKQDKTCGETCVNWSAHNKAN